MVYTSTNDMHKIPKLHRPPLPLLFCYGVTHHAISCHHPTCCIIFLYCFVLSSLLNGLMKMFLYFKVATQSFLQGWNIALIVIGVVAFIIGDGIAGGLGTMLAMKSVHLTG